MLNIWRKSRDSPLKPINANHCISITEKNSELELDTNGETAENVDAVKYLGDIFNSKGNNNDLIESRVKMGKQKIGVRQAFCKKPHSETMKFK